MFSPNQQMATHANLQPMKYAGQNNSSYVDSGLSQAESLVHSSKELENELVSLGKNIKHHEENIKHLKTCISNLDDQIIDTQVTEDKDMSQQQATLEHIMQHEKSIVRQLKNNAKDVLGVVATLGKVNDDNLSRILSEYLGVDTMSALVCMTYNGLEKEGFISKSSGLLGLSVSNGRFNVICLEKLRPYGGEFIPDDPQKRLAFLKPKLPNGESPQGFLGFAVNMIHLSVTSCELRESLFYHLFSRLQVYSTRAHMLQALPFLSHGAVSLDGGLIRSNGVIVFGTRDDDEMRVRFATTCDKVVDMEKKIQELKWKKETRVEEVEREEEILRHVKYTFEVKKQEFVRFMAQSSPYVMQFPIQATPRRLTPR